MLIFFCKERFETKFTLVIVRKLCHIKKNKKNKYLHIIIVIIGTRSAYVVVIVRIVRRPERKV